MRSEVQKTLLVALASMLRPIVSLTLKCGLSSQEFNEIVRSVFISVASDDYGIRGRPTNISRVAAMTGISRKEIRKIRERSHDPNWTPEIETSPASTVLHHWHYDPDFCVSAGNPKPLSLTGRKSFSELVHRYAGDIPIGAMKAELERAAVVIEDIDNRIVAIKHYLHPAEFDEEFVRNITFSIQNLTKTIIHNTNLLQGKKFSAEINEKYGRFERFAWANHVSADAADAFRTWIRNEGSEFLERADDWIGEKELPISQWKSDPTKTVGVGVYYFEDDN